jgi:hypothetical protein
MSPILIALKSEMNANPLINKNIPRIATKVVKFKLKISEMKKVIPIKMSKTPNSLIIIREYFIWDL